jgi:ferrous iron transport protein A
MIEKTAAELAPGEGGTIISLGGGPGAQSRLRALGLAEGRRIRNVSSIAWGGPIVLLVNRAQVAVGRGMARKIVVRIESDRSGQEQ